MTVKSPNAKKINLFIDNNAWDVFYDEQIDLLQELPQDEFVLFITREAEFEIPLMPEEKRNFVENILKHKAVETDVYFGFGDESMPPDQQRIAGFDQGRFCSIEEANFMRTESIGTSKRPTGLYKNEADVSLAARALHSVVLTCDGKKALKRAKENHGGKIIDLKKFIRGTPLADFIRTEIEETNKS